MFSLSEMLSAAGDVAYDWDLTTDHLQWYGAWNSLFGEGVVAPADSQQFYNAIHDDDRHMVFGGEDHAINREYRLRRADGTYIWVHERGSAEFQDHRLTRQRGVLRLIEKREARALMTAEWQGRDALTGCLDRNPMLTHLTKALDAVKIARRSCTYLVLAVDKMSFVNEAMGMETGDALLRGVAARLVEVLPPRALLARVGGDMFGVLLPDPLSRETELLAERLLQNFRNYPIVTMAAPIHITVSIGGVRLPEPAHSAAEAMIFAEQALHIAHQRGRNLFVEYFDSPERMQENRQVLELGERVKRAFKNDGLRLAFQPIIDSHSNQPVLYEALVRMIGDDGQPIPAVYFVPVIEQLGLALDLDRYVLNLAVKELEAQPDLRLAINISGLTASEAHWPDYVREVLSPRRHVAERLVIEITETAAIVDVAETRRFVDTLRAMGGSVALDDFGAGFTSIRHLRALSISIMKIDRDLLHELMKNPEQQHLVRMLINLASGLGIKTIAEGVETADVAEWLRRERVDMMQGYYFGKPSLEKPWARGEDSGTAAAPRTTPADTTVRAGAGL